MTQAKTLYRVYPRHISGVTHGFLDTEEIRTSDSMYTSSSQVFRE